MKGMNSIDKSVRWGDYFRIGEFNIIKKGVKIGSRTTLHNHIVIEENVEIGSDCVIFPFTYLRSGAKIGNGTKIEAGVVIGEGAIIGAGTIVLHDADPEVEYPESEPVTITAEDDLIVEPAPVYDPDIGASIEDQTVESLGDTKTEIETIEEDDPWAQNEETTPES